MPSLQQFFQDVFAQAPAFRAVTNSSFALATDREIAEHLQTDEYVDFQLTEAIRPAMDLKIVPTQGFRHDTYHGEEGDVAIPVVMAAVTRQILFPLFLQLVEQLGEHVDVVLESSHDHSTSGHVDYYREHIDTPVLISTLAEFEDLLLNDGCTGIAVLNPRTPQEVQFDEHKLLIVYGQPLDPMERLLEANAVPLNEQIRMISEAEHVHSSADRFRDQFDQLKMRLGIDCGQDAHWCS
jgi:hypothetical protein